MGLCLNHSVENSADLSLLWPYEGEIWMLSLRFGFYLVFFLAFSSLAFGEVTWVQSGNVYRCAEVKGSPKEWAFPHRCHDKFGKHWAIRKHAQNVRLAEVTPEGGFVRWAYACNCPDNLHVEFRDGPSVDYSCERVSPEGKREGSIGLKACDRRWRNMPKHIRHKIEEITNGGGFLHNVGDAFSELENPAPPPPYSETPVE